jgi:hypothetical protein
VEGVVSSSVQFNLLQSALIFFLLFLWRSLAVKGLKLELLVKKFALCLF